MRLSVKMLLAILFVLSGISGIAQETPKSPWPWMPKELVLKLPLGENNPRNSEGDFLRLPNGDILCVYTRYYGTSLEDHATANLASRRSTDGGKTWTTEDKIEVPNEGKLNVMSVTCRQLANGQSLLFYLVKDAADDCRPYVRKLKEDGTWSERICCIPDVSYNVLNNDRVIQLKSGRLLMPIGRHAKKGEGLYDHEWNADIFCMISDDNGETWTRGGSVVKTEGIDYQEPGVCELSDGRILMNIRTNGGCQYYTYSEDDGQSWGPAFPSCLDSPLSPTLIKRLLGSDELLAVGNPLLKNVAGGGSRVVMTIERLSPDGQKVLVRKTLDHPEKITEDWQYPAIFFVDDNTILVGYFSWSSGAYVYRMSLSDL